MNEGAACRHLLAGAVILWLPLAANAFWMPGTGPCAWMADGLLNGMGNRGYGGGVPYYPPPPAYLPPPQHRPAWPPALPAEVRPEAAIRDAAPAPANP